jgi:hypothetical protein
VDAPLAQVFDGLGNSNRFDLVLTNQSAYTPWESDKNGRQIASGQSTPFAGVSMFADTDVDFRINFYDPGTNDPFVVNDGACDPMPAFGWQCVPKMRCLLHCTPDQASNDFRSATAGGLPNHACARLQISYFAFMTWTPVCL